MNLVTIGGSKFYLFFNIINLNNFYIEGGGMLFGSCKQLRIIRQYLYLNKSWHNCCFKL